MKTLQEWYAQPDSHCKKVYARDTQDNIVNSRGPHARKLCLYGAHDLIYDAWIDSSRVLKIREAIENLFPNRLDANLNPILSFNDHPDTTLEDVRKVVALAGV